MPENRRRNETLTIRVTRAEKEKLKSKARRAKLSLTDYIAALSDKAVIQPPPDLSPLISELKRIGNNINQITMKVNAGVAYVPGLDTVIGQQNELYSLLLRMTEDAQWRR